MFKKNKIELFTLSFCRVVAEKNSQNKKKNGDVDVNLRITTNPYHFIFNVSFSQPEKFTHNQFLNNELLEVLCNNFCVQLFQRKVKFSDLTEDEMQLFSRTVLVQEGHYNFGVYDGIQPIMYNLNKFKNIPNYQL